MTRDLSAFFAPRSVAVVGAGERPTSSGGAVLRNLRIARYGGEIIPVNRKGGAIFGLPVRRGLHELNAPADPVVIVEGRARDAELRQIVAAHDLTVAGPNCAGIIHLPEGARFAATFLRDLPPGGSIAFISQSGAIAEEVIATTNRMRLPVGTVVTIGNALQLGIADFLAHAGADPATMAVLLYIESLDDPERFRAVARRVAATKPVIALIGGRTAPGARAAAAHTGAGAIDDAAIEAFCRDCGVLRVTTLRRLMLAGKGFAAFPAGIGKRVLILSNSGGPGVLCTDQAAAEGLDLVALPERMAATLRAALPGEASVANPLDLLADAREDRFGLTFEATIREGKAAFDAILGIHVVPFMVEAGPIVARLAALVPGAALPVMHSMMGTLPDKADWFATLEAAGVSCFDDVEAMAECAGLLAHYPALRSAAATDTTRPIRLRGRGKG